MGKGRAAAVGAVAGGFICAGLTMAAIAGMVVLSLISIYPSSSAAQGSGAEYRINALMMKGIYTNVSFTFNNGLVAESSTLSSLCTSVYATRGARAFSNCVLTSLRAYGRYNTSNTSRRRRRASDDVGGYFTGIMRLFFSTTCEKQSDRSKYANSSGLSNCAKERLATCNSFINQSSFQSWTPIPNGFALSAVDNSSSGYQQLVISRFFLIPSYISTSYASSFNLTNSFLSLLTVGCQYIGPISISDIAAIVAAQFTDTTTAPSSTLSG